MASLPSLRSTMAALWLGVTLLGCSQSSDVISNNLNACLIVTEAEVEFAIGTPVTPGLRQNDRQCLYQAKRNPQETVVVELNAGPDGDRKTLFQDQRSKAGNQPVPGVGDGAFTLRSPIGGIQLTFLKSDALVTLSLTSPKQANPQAAVTNLAKVAANRLGAPIRTTAAAAEPGITGTPSLWAGEWY
ncbi:MAG TPA: hypothetical protein PK589_10440, partial [Nitrospira sp.]|nr:hypothetical protein [Nitrospira sp.]